MARYNYEPARELVTRSKFVITGAAFVAGLDAMTVVGSGGTISVFNYEVAAVAGVMTCGALCMLKWAQRLEQRSGQAGLTRATREPMRHWTSNQPAAPAAQPAPAYAPTQPDFGWRPAQPAPAPVPAPAPAPVIPAPAPTQPVVPAPAQVPAQPVPAVVAAEDHELATHS